LAILSEGGGGGVLSWKKERKEGTRNGSNWEKGAGKDKGKRLGQRRGTHSSFLEERAKTGKKKGWDVKGEKSTTY